MGKNTLSKAFRLVERCAKACDDGALLAEIERLRRAFALLSGMRDEADESAEDGAAFDADGATHDEIMARASSYVVGQKEGVRRIVDFILMKKRIRRALDEGVEARDLPEARAMLVVGTSASGKTHVIKTVARAFGMELFTISYASLTGCGWKGTSVTDVLVQVCEFQEENPGAFCVVAFDECDKHVGGPNVERSFDPATDLLKVMDATNGTYEFTSEHGDKKKRVLDLTRVAIVFAGAFTGIEDVIARRLVSRAGGSLGFASGEEGLLAKAMDKDALRARLAPEDLVSYGILSEMVGRYGSIVSLPALTVEELVEVIRDAEHSILKRFGRLLPKGVKAYMSDEAAHRLARASAESDIGVRLAENAISSLMAEAVRTACEAEGVRSVYLMFDENADEPRLRYRMDDGSLQDGRSSR